MLSRLSPVAVAPDPGKVPARPLHHLAAVVAAIVLLAGCGGDGDGGGSAEPQTQAGCDTLVETQTEELYVQKLFNCTTGGVETRVYTFNDNEARDNWRETGEQFGAVVVESGNRWLEVKK